MLFSCKCQIRVLTCFQDSKKCLQSFQYTQWMPNGPEWWRPPNTRHTTSSHRIVQIPTSPTHKSEGRMVSRRPGSHRSYNRRGLEPRNRGPNHSITPTKRSRPLGEADPAVSTHLRNIYTYIHIILRTTTTGPGIGERNYGGTNRVEQICA